jgi:DNA-binding Lrp family transcriptional regulator
MKGLDVMDEKILKEMTANCRRSLRKISRELGISVTTLANRIDRLEKLGVIKGYSAIINPEELGYELTAIIEITVSKGKLIEVEKEIAKRKNVFAVYDVTGLTDAMVLARFRKRSELNSFIKSLLGMEHIERTNTHLVLNIVKTNERIEI